MKIDPFSAPFLIIVAASLLALAMADFYYNETTAHVCKNDDNEVVYFSNRKPHKDLIEAFGYKTCTSIEMTKIDYTHAENSFERRLKYRTFNPHK